MDFKVVSLYQFVALDDYIALRDPLFAFCEERGIKGILLLASEGINGTVAGSDEVIEALLDELIYGPLFGGRLNALEMRHSRAQAVPFWRMRVRLKKEIVTLRQEKADPLEQVGTYVDAADWNDLITDPDVTLIDTRNAFEVNMGSFEGAIDPKTKSFGGFPEFIERELDPAKHKKIAMFCTGGIRCEKASSYMLAQGFEEIFHLKGGILTYLETMGESESLWQGRCFVFDKRVALGHGLVELGGDDIIEGDRFGDAISKP